MREKGRMIEREREKERQTDIECVREKEKVIEREREDLKKLPENNPKKQRIGAAVFVVVFYTHTQTKYIS